MKKLLLLLFSVMISFNSYGKWTKTSEGIEGEIFHIDFQTIKKLDNGNVVFWVLVDLDESVDGYISSKMYWQGDCFLSRMKVLSLIQYEEPMGGGESLSLDGLIGLEGADAWQYLPPDSIGYMNLEEVCSLVEHYSKSNYEDKVLELIAEFDSYEWDYELEALRVAAEEALGIEQQNRALADAIEREREQAHIDAERLKRTQVCLDEVEQQFNNRLLELEIERSELQACSEGDSSATRLACKFSLLLFDSDNELGKIRDEYNYEFMDCHGLHNNVD